MIDYCPRCQSDLIIRNGQRTADYCQKCNGIIGKHECVVCNETYYSVGSGVHWSNHHCNKRKLSNRDGAYKSDRLTRYTPTESERLAEGFHMMEDDDTE